jgi:hypothetical protein
LFPCIFFFVEQIRTSLCHAIVTKTGWVSQRHFDLCRYRKWAISGVLRHPKDKTGKRHIETHQIICTSVCPNRAKATTVQWQPSWYPTYHKLHIVSKPTKPSNLSGMSYFTHLSILKRTIQQNHNKTNVGPWLVVGTSTNWKQPLNVLLR